MKKLLAFLLACMIVAGMSTVFAETEESIKLTTVRVSDPTTTFDKNDPEKESFYQNRWNTAYARELGIDLDMAWVAADNDSNSSKWTAAIASGNVPDFAVVNDDVYVMLVESGLVADMTELFDEYASEDYKNSIKESNIQAMTFDGKLLGLPMATPILNGVTMLFVRQDWLDQLNLPVPSTVEEVISTAKAFQQAKLGGENTIGILFNNRTGAEGKWDGFLNGFGAYDGIWIEKDNKLVYGNVQEEMKTALLAMQDLYKQGIINPDFAVTTSDLAQEYIVSGKCGIWYATRWTNSGSGVALVESIEGAKESYAMPPSVEGQQYKVQSEKPTTRYIFVSNKCEHPEAVVQIINKTFELYYNDYNNYGIGEDGFLWYKYSVIDKPEMATTTVDLAKATVAYEDTGEFMSKDPTAYPKFENWQRALNGDPDIAKWYLMTYGHGTISEVLAKGYDDGMYMMDAYAGLPTQTQTLMGDVINDELEAAMFEVVLGADISVYENAVANWYSNGGDQITEEVNDWYRVNAE